MVLCVNSTSFQEFDNLEFPTVSLYGKKAEKRSVDLENHNNGIYFMQEL